MSKLTVVQVGNTKLKDKAYKFADCHGMYLYIAPYDLMTWRYRYRIGGKESTFTDLKKHLTNEEEKNSY